MPSKCESFDVGRRVVSKYLVALFYAEMRVIF